MTRGIVNGTYNGTTCDGQCKTLPKPPPLGQQLADFAAAWQNETWTCVLRSTSVSFPPSLSASFFLLSHSLALSLSRRHREADC